MNERSKYVVSVPKFHEESFASSEMISLLLRIVIHKKITVKCLFDGEIYSYHENLYCLSRKLLLFKFKRYLKAFTFDRHKKTN